MSKAMLASPAKNQTLFTMWLGPLIVSLCTLVMHLIAAGRYGIFRDEFYYLACADHLAWGYVDHPPFSIVMLSLWRSIFGDGVMALRMPGILLHVVMVLGAGKLAGQLGGRAFARFIAATAIAVLPCAMAIFGFYSMNAWDMVFWLVVAMLVVRLLAGS